MSHMSTSAGDDWVRLRQYRRAADYLALAMIFLRDNVLVRAPLRRDHLKPRLLGHWGTCPGITLAYSGLNRLVRTTGADVLLVTGPGHGAPANHANLWLEGTHELFDAALSRDGAGLERLVRGFSWPGGFPSHLSPQVPGVIHEGGELGYALATAFGAALDAPERVVACIVGDGEAETGPTAGAWHSSKYLDPVTCGAVLPILHVNGYKIASPTQSGTMTDEELLMLYRGYGWAPTIVDVRMPYDSQDEQPDAVFGNALADAYSQICTLQKEARAGTRPRRVKWPMLIVRSRKGWGAPGFVNGQPIEDTFHAHQVPLPHVHDDDEQFAALETWLHSYRPWELFDSDGRPIADVVAMCPTGARRLGANPAANGGQLRQPLELPAIEQFAVDVPKPGHGEESATSVLGSWLKEILALSSQRRDFRLVSPDELESNRLGAVLEASARVYEWPVEGYAEHLANDGRVMEVLSEHNCQGWLQGYLLTGRHGVFPCYEAFVSIVDGMLNQYAKFLKMAGEVAWRSPISSLNYLLTSEGWRQEHNGYSHQGPGFINNLLTKKSSAVRIYLPPDANTLLVTMQDCLSSVNRINVVVAGKNEMVQWLSLDDAIEHCRAGASAWEWASTDEGHDPDVVLACAGSAPTIETLAASWMLRRDVPELRLRVVNVVDLLSLSPPGKHPHGMSNEDFAACFGTDAPVVFDFHGYPSAVHDCLHGRGATDRFHVKGYIEEGTTTTPYDLLASNGVSRHDLAIEVLRRAPGWSSSGGELATSYAHERDELRAEVRVTGSDPAWITNWTWS